MTETEIIAEQAKRIAHLSRLLAAVAMRTKGGEVHVAKSTLDQLKAEEPARALFEYFDAKTEQVVLCFRHKALATYLVEEPICKAQTQPSMPSSSASIPTSPTHYSTTPASHRPLTDSELAALETKARQVRTARAMKRNAPA